MTSRIPKDSEHLNGNRQLIERRDFAQGRVTSYLELKLQEFKQDTVVWRIPGRLYSVAEDEWPQEKKQVFYKYVDLVCFDLVQQLHAEGREWEAKRLQLACSKEPEMARSKCDCCSGIRRTCVIC